jgi:hypothetical protein
MIRASKLKFAIQLVLAALVAFAGSGALLKLGSTNSLGPAGGPAALGLLSYVVAALLILTGALLIFMAATDLIHARRTA